MSKKLPAATRVSSFKVISGEKNFFSFIKQTRHKPVRTTLEVNGVSFSLDLRQCQTRTSGSFLAL